MELLSKWIYIPLAYSSMGMVIMLRHMSPSGIVCAPMLLAHQTYNAAMPHTHFRQRFVLELQSHFCWYTCRYFCTMIWFGHKAIQMCHRSILHTVRSVAPRDVWSVQRHIALAPHTSTVQLKLSQRTLSTGASSVLKARERDGKEIWCR